MTGEDGAPAKDDTRLPVPWRHSLEKQVAWHFEDNVAYLRDRQLRRAMMTQQAYEVDGLDPVVLVWSHVELGENVIRLADLQHLRAGSIRVVNLLKSASASSLATRLTFLMRYIIPMTSKNLRSTLRMIALLSSGVKDDKNASLLSVISLVSLDSTVGLSMPFPIFLMSRLEVIESERREGASVRSPADEWVHHETGYENRYLMRSFLPAESVAKHATRF